jgi:hypothetical protein
MLRLYFRKLNGYASRTLNEILVPQILVVYVQGHGFHDFSPGSVGLGGPVGGDTVFLVCSAIRLPPSYTFALLEA